MVFFESFGICGQEQEPHRILEARSLGLKLGDLQLSKLPQLGIGERGFVVRDLLLEIAILVERVHQRLDLSALAVEARELLPIAEHLRLAEELVELDESFGELLEALSRQHGSRSKRRSGADRRVRRKDDVGRAVACLPALAKERRAKRRERHLELIVVGLDGGDALDEKPWEEQRPQRARRAIPREEALDLERDGEPGAGAWKLHQKEEHVVEQT